MPPNAAQLLTLAPQTWGTWEFSRSDALPIDNTAEALTLDRASLRLASGALIVDRSARTIEAALHRSVSAELLVHPGLGSVAAIVGWWGSAIGFHAGSFAVNGSTWVVCGARTRGKSSVMAGLAARGIDVIGDDVAIVDAERVFAGPRCVDLRGDTASRFPHATSLGLVGDRERWRLSLPPVEAESQLAGFIELAWSPGEIRLERLSPSSTLKLLTENLVVRVAPRDPSELLRLVALPAFRLTRPKEWALFDASLDALVGVAER